MPASIAAGPPARSAAVLPSRPERANVVRRSSSASTSGGRMTAETRPIRVLAGGRPSAAHRFAGAPARRRAGHRGRGRGRHRGRGEAARSGADGRRPHGLPPARWHRRRGHPRHQGALAERARRDADRGPGRRDRPRVDPGRRGRLPHQGSGRRRRRRHRAQRPGRRDPAAPLGDHRHRPARGERARPAARSAPRSSRSPRASSRSCRRWPRAWPRPTSANGCSSRGTRSGRTSRTS